MLFLLELCHVFLDESCQLRYDLPVLAFWLRSVIDILYVPLLLLLELRRIHPLVQVCILDIHGVLPRVQLTIPVVQRFFGKIGRVRQHGLRVKPDVLLNYLAVFVDNLYEDSSIMFVGIFGMLTYLLFGFAFGLPPFINSRIG